MVQVERSSHSGARSFTEDQSRWWGGWIKSGITTYVDVSLCLVGFRLPVRPVQCLLGIHRYYVATTIIFSLLLDHQLPVVTHVHVLDLTIERNY
ncbi:hypothetical protein OPQ81_007235 [Rhizoctonia solani]|nr:hypothetical protein OPQ81_007235 [Rhizoctonia solani]